MFTKDLQLQLLIFLNTIIYSLYVKKYLIDFYLKKTSLRISKMQIINYENDMFKNYVYKDTCVIFDFFKIQPCFFNI